MASNICLWYLTTITTRAISAASMGKAIASPARNTSISCQYLWMNPRICLWYLTIAPTRATIPAIAATQGFASIVPSSTSHAAPRRAMTPMRSRIGPGMALKMSSRPVKNDSTTGATRCAMEAPNFSMPGRSRLTMSGRPLTAGSSA